MLVHICMCVGTPRNSRGPPFGGGRNCLEPSKEPEKRVEGTGLSESFHGLTEIIWKINVHIHIRHGTFVSAGKLNQLENNCHDRVQVPDDRCTRT